MSMECASDVKADIGLRALGDDTCRMCHSDGCCPLAMDTCGTGSDRWWHCKSGGATTAGVAFCKETSSTLRLTLLASVPIVAVAIVVTVAIMHCYRRGAAVVACPEPAPVDARGVAPAPARRQWVRMNL